MVFFKHSPFVGMVCVLIASLTVLAACENDISAINSATETSQKPDMTGENTVVYYSDSAVLKVRLDASVVERYIQSDPPLTLFPKGIKVTFYDERGVEEAKLTALWAALHEDKELWEVKGNVTYTNVTGVRLNTEQAFWNRRKELFYSDKFTRYTDRDGTNYTGQYGFEAAQDMSKWKLFQTKNGSFTIVE